MKYYNFFESVKPTKMRLINLFSILTIILLTTNACNKNEDLVSFEPEKDDLVITIQDQFVAPPSRVSVFFKVETKDGTPVSGLTEENFQISLRIGWGLISRMRAGDLDIGITECSSCKIQMEQGTTVPTLHPLKLLALSYGLMPEIRKKLVPATGRLVVT